MQLLVNGTANVDDAGLFSLAMQAMVGVPPHYGVEVNGVVGTDAV